MNVRRGNKNEGDQSKQGTMLVTRKTPVKEEENKLKQGKYERSCQLIRARKSKKLRTTFAHFLNDVRIYKVAHCSRNLFSKSKK